MKRNFHLRLKHSLSDILQLGGRECLPRLKGRVLASGILCVNSISDTSQEKVGKKNPDALNSRTPPSSLCYSLSAPYHQGRPPSWLMPYHSHDSLSCKAGGRWQLLPCLRDRGLTPRDEADQ